MPSPAGSGARAFQIKLSVEKDAAAHQTLLLRSFFRQFPLDEVADDYYSFVRGEITRTQLFDRHPEKSKRAGKEAWLAELGVVAHDTVRERIQEALGPAPPPWVLIGGPPCQAYSTAGRVRIKDAYRKKQKAEVEAGKRDKAEFDPEGAFDADKRHFLYREYLRIIADHRPAVFVMENVPGLLSAKVAGEPVIGKILKDLAAPIESLPDEERPSDSTPLHYTLRTFKEDGLFKDGVPRDPRDFVLDASEYGVPQARRRILIVGIRSDFSFERWPQPLKRSVPVTVGEAIGDLPKLRSTLSREQDSAETRAAVIRSIYDQPWFKEIGMFVQPRIRNAVDRISGPMGLLEPRSQEAPGGRTKAVRFMEWCRDDALGCTANHEARAHMRSDLWRYLFAACFAMVGEEVSPHLRHFPTGLLPQHASAHDGGKVKDVAFGDRFRVQVRDRPSTTVVSHIARDGHYYIHYDASQCRSLTVREAARLQSFPDNYYFEGNRTQQFGQVGNAVPPLLAREVARTVLSFVSKLSNPPASAMPQSEQAARLPVAS